MRKMAMACQMPGSDVGGPLIDDLKWSETQREVTQAASVGTILNGASDDGE